MCDFATLQEIETVVLEKCQNAELFTAFDVTKAVRAKVGRSVSVPHNDVKQEVHNLFASGQMGSDYTRTLGNLPLASGIPQPWVYHPTTVPASNYGSGIPQLSAPAPAVSTPVAAVVSTNGSDDGVNQTSDGYFKVDGRETLCVPKSLLEAVGLHPGDEAHVAADALAGHVVVCKTPPDQTVLTPLSTYTVDKYGNVRITQHTLVKGGCGGKLYEIDGDASKVVVRKHS
jgi:bifunctional DNA-binding transcriptional regulator/antitoxin component of YhaV-PrlF toxin-antitoxin module